MIIVRALVLKCEMAIIKSSCALVGLICNNAEKTSLIFERIEVLVWKYEVFRVHSYFLINLSLGDSPPRGRILSGAPRRYLFLRELFGRLWCSACDPVSGRQYGKVLSEGLNLDRPHGTILGSS